MRDLRRVCFILLARKWKVTANNAIGIGLVWSVANWNYLWISIS